jgi:glycosyltransferase involved in cell wall biosynthesis
VTESFPPDVNGVAHTSVRVAEHLASRGHQPLVIAPEPARGRPRPDGAFDFPVVRVRSMAVPVYRGLRVGLPGRQLRGELLVGYVGRLAPEKRVDLLAQEAGLPGVRLVIVGAGPSEAALRRVLPSARLIACRFHAMLVAAGHQGGPPPDTEPGNPPPTRLADFTWLGTKGTAWVLRWSTDLVPSLLAMAVTEWRSGQAARALWPRR